MQLYYKVRPKDRADADKNFVSACKKLIYNLAYEAKFVAITHFYHDTKNEQMPKKRIKDEGIQISKEDYMLVSNLSRVLPVGAKFHHLFLKWN